MSRFFFTSRAGGVSTNPYASFNLATHVGDNLNSVKANRAQLSKLIDVAEDKIFYMNQVHGKKVAIIDELSDANQAITADALFTTRGDVALAVLVADCIPVLLISPDAVAAVHVGRRGLTLGIINEVMNVFSTHGVSQSSISAQIGPAICVRCYEVGFDLYREVVEVVPSAASTFESPEGKPCLDIHSGVIAQLREFGVTWNSQNKCTAHNEQYFSYRRDGVTGRQAGVVSLLGGNLIGS